MLCYVNHLLLSTLTQKIGKFMDYPKINFQTTAT